MKLEGPHELETMKEPNMNLNGALEHRPSSELHEGRSRESADEPTIATRGGGEVWDFQQTQCERCKQHVIWVVTPTLSACGSKPKKKL